LGEKSGNKKVEEKSKRNQQKSAQGQNKIFYLKGLSYQIPKIKRQKRIESNVINLKILQHKFRLQGLIEKQFLKSEIGCKNGVAETIQTFRYQPDIQKVQRSVNGRIARQQQISPIICQADGPNKQEQRKDPQKTFPVQIIGFQAKKLKISFFFIF
jgi:hypothetical protein